LQQRIAQRILLGDGVVGGGHAAGAKQPQTTTQQQLAGQSDFNRHRNTISLLGQFLWLQLQQQLLLLSTQTLANAFTTDQGCTKMRVRQPQKEVY
jgi:hypothetical protein